MTFDSVLPLISPRVWRGYTGGALLERLHGRPAGEDTHFPEEWIASTTRAINPGREHIADEGLSRLRLPDGSTPYVRDVLAQHALPLLGEAHVVAHGPTSDVLVKFLDSAVRLAIQAHPLPQFSRRHLNSEKGKTEAWLILDVRHPSGVGYVYLGFQRPPSRARWRQLLERGTATEIEALFDPLPVRAGEVYLVPGSITHAIGAGVLMVEVQEPSDWVVRCEPVPGASLVEERARFMGLPVDVALDMFDYAPTPLPEVRRRWQLEPQLLLETKAGRLEQLITTQDTPCFAAQRAVAEGVLELANPSYGVGIVTAGQGAVLSGGRRLPVRAGDSFIIPHAVPSLTLHAEGAPLGVTIARRD